MTQSHDILLIEDNLGDVELLREGLEESHLLHHLHVVTNGADALRFLHQEGAFRDALRPDLILMDLNLPGKGGQEILAEIKTNPQFKTIPVVILTSSEAESDIRRSYSLHANSYIIKPVDFKDLAEMLKTIDGYWRS